MTQVLKKKTGWSYTVRGSGLLEWTCPHGCGHPAQKSAEALMAKGMGRHILVHGCCNCCRRPDFPDNLLKSAIYKGVEDERRIEGLENKHN